MSEKQWLSLLLLSGIPVAVTHPGNFRLCGHGVLDYGFQLTANPNIATLPQQGVFICRMQFELEQISSEIFLKFDYHMHGQSGGEGLCAYLLDPSVKGWCVRCATTCLYDLTVALVGLVGTQTLRQKAPSDSPAKLVLWLA